MNFEDLYSMGGGWLLCAGLGAGQHFVSVYGVVAVGEDVRLLRRERMTETVVEA